MPRRARMSLPGVSVHLIQRGNNRSACFYADEDYLFYLDVLMEQAKKHGCAIHTWCLMTNHVHLLVTPESSDSAGLMMKGLGQRYVQYVNRTYRRSGTLWEGRFRSCLMQEEAYVLACYNNRGQTTFIGLGLWNSMEGGLYATSSTHFIARCFTSSDSEREQSLSLFSR